MDRLETSGGIKTQGIVCKWLCGLLIVQIINLTYGILAQNINFGQWDKWCLAAINAAALFFVIQLWREHKAYGVAAVLLSIDFICTLLWRFLFNNTAVFRYFYERLRMDNPMDILQIGYKINEIGALCGLVAFFFELLAHRSIVKAKNKRLSNGWLGLGISVVVLYILMKVLTGTVENMLNSGTLNIALYQQVYPLLNLPGILLKLAYAVLLLLTERVLRIEEECAQ